MFIIFIITMNTVSGQNNTSCAEGCEESQNENRMHKDFWPLLPSEYIGMVLLIVIVIITNAAGIGGGGAILPIMMIFSFNITQAVALSNFVIFYWSDNEIYDGL